MRYLKILIALLLILTGGASADYYFTYEGEELADLKLVIFFNGDSVETAHDADSGITSFVTTYNTDSIGYGVFQFKVVLSYINTGIVQSYTDGLYDNSRGQGDGRAIARIYSYDTTGAALVSGVEVTIYSSTGQFQQMRTTVNGFVDFYMAQAGTYIAYGSNPPGCPFDTTHFTVDTGVSGTSVDTIFAACYSMPAPAGGVNYVTAYIDLGEGALDTSGAMVPRTDVTLYVILSGYGSNSPRIDSTWGILPKEYSATANANGRVMFRVPANTVITPSGTHWELSWSASGSTSMFTRKLMFKCYLDTIPDPINLLNATRAN